METEAFIFQLKYFIPRKDIYNPLVKQKFPSPFLVKPIYIGFVCFQLYHWFHLRGHHQKVVGQQRPQ
jgi:hypothetical protein